MFRFSPRCLTRRQGHGHGVPLKAERNHQNDWFTVQLQTSKQESKSEFKFWNDSTKNQTLHPVDHQDTNARDTVILQCVWWEVQIEQLEEYKFCLGFASYQNQSKAMSRRHAGFGGQRGPKQADRRNSCRLPPLNASWILFSCFFKELNGC